MKISLQTTKRAQVQNSRQAMRNQIKSALIELITNSDDAYHATNSDGPIRIELADLDQEEFEFQFDSPVDVSVSVFDRAGGIDINQMQRKLSEYGQATSALAEGGTSRGFLGRGAKDVHIFGFASFQSVNSGHFRELTMNAEGEGELFEPRELSVGIRERLHLGSSGGGLRASVLVSSPNASSVPKFATLAKSLRQEAQLRYILQERHVTLEDKRSGKKEVLTPSHESGSEILHEQVPIPGYENACTLRLFLLSKEQAGEANSATSHGILVHTGCVAFENSWFNFRNQAGTEWLRAELELPDALRIQKEEADKISAQEGLIKLDRSGVNPSHPYFKSAVSAISPLLLNQLSSISAEKRVREGETASTKRASAEAAQALAQILKEFFDELEDEPAGSGPNASFSDFDAIPGGVRVGLNSRKTISLRAKKELTDSPLQVWEEKIDDSASPITGKIGTLGSTEWKEHPRLDREFAQWRFESGSSPGIAVINFELGGHVTTCRIVVAETEQEERDAPQSLEFEKEQHQVSPGRGKNLTLIAPAAHSGTEVSLDYSSNQLSGPMQVVLNPSEDEPLAIAKIHVTAGQEIGKSEIRAENQTTGESAMTSVEVKLASNMAGFRPNLQVDATKNPSSRATFRLVKNVYTSIIYPEHPSFNGVFGVWNETGGGYSRDSEQDVRALMGVTHAEQVARFMADREAEEYGLDPAAVLQVFFKHHTRLARVLGKIYMADPLS